MCDFPADQSVTLESITKLLDRARAIMNWTLFFTAAVSLSFSAMDGTGKLLGSDVEPFVAICVMNAIGMISLCSMSDVFMRLEVIFRKLDPEHLNLGLSRASMHPWYANPFIPDEMRVRHPLNLAGLPILAGSLTLILCLPQSAPSRGFGPVALSMLMLAVLVHTLLRVSSCVDEYRKTASEGAYESRCRKRADTLEFRQMQFVMIPLVVTFGLFYFQQTRAMVETESGDERTMTTEDAIIDSEHPATTNTSTEEHAPADSSVDAVWEAR